MRQERLLAFRYSSILFYPGHQSWKQLSRKLPLGYVSVRLVYDANGHIRPSTNKRPLMRWRRRFFWRPNHNDLKWKEEIYYANWTHTKEIDFKGEHLRLSNPLLNHGKNSLGNHSICLATADISPTLKFLKLGLLHLKWVSFQTQKSNLGKLKQRRKTFLLFQKIGREKKFMVLSGFFWKTNFKDCFFTSLWFVHFVSSFMDFWILKMAFKKLFYYLLREITGRDVSCQLEYGRT